VITDQSPRGPFTDHESLILHNFLCELELGHVFHKLLTKNNGRLCSACLPNPQPQTYHRHQRNSESEDAVGRLLVIDVVCVIAVLVVWYVLFAVYNRRRGAEALRWVQSACAGKGRILESRWLSSSRLSARLHFASRSFENAQVSMQFRPRPMPVQWFLSQIHKQKETLTFEADLGGSPNFHLEVFRHRWCAHSRGVTKRKRDGREWDIYEPGPIVLTTRTHWKEDSAPELNTLMTVRQQDVLQVRFRPESPQFSATIALEALHDPRTASGFLTTLRELAAGASAHRQ
jgi:hypothetical protein